MFDVRGSQFGWAGQFGRRDILRVGAVSALGLTLPEWLERSAWAQAVASQSPASQSPASQSAASQPSAPQAKARSVIQLWLGGGPCHIDTFDPKPGAGKDYCGPYTKAISTKVDGIQLAPTLPLMAEQAAKFSILRGMTHPANGHEVATYIMQTGTLPSGELVYPAVGAVVALKKGYEGGYQGAVPPYVTIPAALGRFSEPGFLGSAYAPFATGGDPSASDFRVGISDPATRKRADERRALLQSVDTFAREQDNNGELARLSGFQQKAYDLVLGSAKKAFDLSQEDDKLRDRYGRHKFGQSCLLALRLVENGVPFVTVNSGGWDTHKQHFERMAQMLPQLDQGFSALLDDLARRGLLNGTIVLCGGEFGRTPKIQNDPPWNGGRGHYCTAFSCAVAGGGFAGGKVVGVTDQRGERVRERPVYPWDLSGSIYKLMGIDPNGQLPHPHGCVAYVTPRNAESGGLLTEIM
jgi:hypothetical protein